MRNFWDWANGPPLATLSELTLSTRSHVCRQADRWEDVAGRDENEVWEAL